MTEKYFDDKNHSVWQVVGKRGACVGAAQIPRVLFEALSDNLSIGVWDEQKFRKMQVYRIANGGLQHLRKEIVFTV